MGFRENITQQKRWSQAPGSSFAAQKTFSICTVFYPLYVQLSPHSSSSDVTSVWSSGPVNAAAPLKNSTSRRREHSETPGANLGSERHSNNHLLASLTELRTLVSELGPRTERAVLDSVRGAGRMSGSNQPQDLVSIKELELTLDSCSLELTAVDEVWPNLYIGNV